MKETTVKGAKTHFPGTHLSFDRFHLKKLVNEGVDKVRKIISKIREDLKGSRYLWLKRKHYSPCLFEWVSWVKAVPWNR